MDALTDETDTAPNLQKSIFHIFDVLRCKAMQRKDMGLSGLSHFEGLFTRNRSVGKTKQNTRH